ncbi:MAG: 2Fe-2S iron-sulfur cluster-binding protein [Desulfobacterales bacterium]|jgi:NADH dehydrogenase/NADH:ubiquinone oxidoreductase subunit G
MATITIDGKAIEAAKGANLLKTCLENGIYVPNLCYLEQRPVPTASCRLCFVQIEGQPAPTAACTVSVSDGLTVRTDTEPVRRLQRAGLELLLSVHHVACKTCPANRKCALQDIARFLKVGLKSRRLPRQLKDEAVVSEHPCIDYHPNRCVLCGKCVAVCRLQGGPPQLAFAGRGFATVITAFGATEADCTACLACIDICPVGALTARDATARDAV